MFEEPAGPEHRVAVRLDKIRLERGLRFGDVWLGWTLWRALRFDEVFAQLIPQGREEVSWPVMAAVLVLARLSEPSSELHIAEDWYRKTVLEDLMGLTAPTKSTRTACTGPWIRSCHTSQPSSSTSGRGSESCSTSSTTCCSTT